MTGANSRDFLYQGGLYRGAVHMRITDHVHFSRLGMPSWDTRAGNPGAAAGSEFST